MRKPDKNEQLSVPSLQEIKAGIDIEAIRYRSVGPRLPGHRAATSHILNAVACWFLSQPINKRNEILAIGMEAYRHRLESDNPIGFDDSAPSH